MLNALAIMLATLVSFLSFISSLGAQGDTAWDSDAYVKEVNGRFPVVRELTFGQFPPPRLEVTWDPIFEEAWAAVEAANGFDMVEASNLMPDAFYYDRWRTALLPWFYDSLSERWLAQSIIYHEQDNFLMKTLYRVAGVMVKMPNSMHFAAEAVKGDPDDYEFVIYFGYIDGSRVHMKTGTTYNKKTGRIGTDNGFGNLGFNYMVKDNILETTNDSWQRNLGYTKLYDDIFLQTTIMTDIDTVRLKFCYEGKDWMIQLWKGRYFNMPGGEVGIYNKPKTRFVDFYDAVSDEDRIGMSFKLSDKEKGVVLIDRPLAIHWWKTSFATYEKPLNGEKLTLETILAPKDEAMMAALKAALDKEVAKGILRYTPLNTKFGPAVRVVW